MVGRKLVAGVSSLFTLPKMDFQPSTIAIPLTATCRAIRTRDELTNVPQRRDEAGPYNVGDMLWVKLPGFPHWPAMVAKDPTDGRFARSSSTGFCYHVQYFGEATRNWAKPGQYWPYEGPELILPNSKKSVIPKTPNKAHLKAITEASQAHQLDPITRVKKLTFNYILVDPSATKKRKTPLKSSSRQSKSKNDSVYEFDETIDQEDEEPGELIWSRPKNITPPPPSTPTKEPASATKEEMSPAPTTPTTNNNGSSRPLKRMRGSSILKKPDPPPADAMTSSEDASSTSDLEAPDVRLDKLCNVCQEENGPFYFCSGTCLRTMHAACGGSESTNNNSDNFICQECKTGKHPCFVCNSAEGESVKCCHKNCGKYYHVACLDPQSYPANIRSAKSFTCPMHYCLTCYTDQPYPRDINCLKPTKRQLMKCLGCPTAFHNDDACTAAGTVILSGNHVMCPAHRVSKNEKHVNVSWCFSCNDGGNLICCESCPAAFHADCIDNPPKTNDEQYFCYDCQSRKQLHYGDVIWIKLGTYRWWPAKISHPHTVPENIMNLSHTAGDFPVYFFGSHDYYWSHKGRVFVFVEEDGDFKYGKTNDKKYKVAIAEARAEYAERKIKDEERIEKLKLTEKPRFRLIKQNRPVNNVSQSTQDDIKMSAKQRCDCKPDGDVLCGSDDCLNRLMMLECEPNSCPVGDKCKNQRFRKRQYPVCVPFRTDQVGWGLRTTQDIKKGEFVIEYVGELIDEAECNRRMEMKMDKGDNCFYFLTIDKERIIDAGPAANHARFMNHSCQPNCETQKWVVNGQTKVGLFAICDIPAGTELTFNYNLDCRGNEKMQCRCNSENCSGFIGLPVKNAKKPS